MNEYDEFKTVLKTAVLVTFLILLVIITLSLVSDIAEYIPLRRGAPSREVIRADPNLLIWLYTEIGGLIGCLFAGACTTYRLGLFRCKQTKPRGPDTQGPAI